MFSYKKQDPYVLRMRMSEEQLKTLMDESFSLYDQVKTLISSIRLKWSRQGLMEREVNDAAGRQGTAWYQSIFTDF